MLGVVVKRLKVFGGAPPPGKAGRAAGVNRSPLNSLVVVLALLPQSTGVASFFFLSLSFFF